MQSVDADSLSSLASLNSLHTGPSVLTSLNTLTDGTADAAHHAAFQAQNAAAAAALGMTLAAGASAMSGGAPTATSQHLSSLHKELPQMHDLMGLTPPMKKEPGTQ